MRWGHVIGSMKMILFVGSLNKAHVISSIIGLYVTSGYQKAKPTTSRIPKIDHVFLSVYGVPSKAQELLSKYSLKFMKFDSIRIILVATTHPGNIGSAARAMKTMGLSRLYLVNPNLNPYRKAHELAAGAYDILQNAVICDTLEEALHGCHLICGTSARPRDLSLPGLNPSQCAQLMVKQAEDTEIAIVFGREHAGLTNEELLLCHYHLHIPSNPDFSSLNLAQAVQIIAYEYRMHALTPVSQVETHRDPLATSAEAEQFYAHLEQVLIQIDFLKPSNPRKLLQRLRRLFNRARLETTELNILRGILTQIQVKRHES